MKKAGLSHVGVYALITFVLLLFLGVIFIFYSHQRSRHIEARGLRTLGAISNSLSQKIAALKRPILEVVKELEDHQDLDQEQIRHFLLLHFQKIKGIGGIQPERDLQILEKQGDPGQAEDNIRIRVAKSRMQIAWSYGFDHEMSGQSSHYHITLALPIDRGFLFDNLIYRDLFEHIFVVHHMAETDSAPELIFNFNSNESRINRIDQLKTPEDEVWNFAEYAMQSAMTDVKVANQRYKLFSQPVTIQELTGNGETARGTPWVIMGMMAKDRLNREARAFSPNVAVFLLMLLLFGIFTLPVIKLYYINADDTLDLADVFSICLSLFLGLSLATLFAVNLISYQYLRSRTDQNLDLVAETIKSRFASELSQALIQLDALDRTRLPEKEEQIDNSETQVFNMLSVIPGLSAQTLHYPYFKMIFWTNERGEQVARWKTKGTPTPLINIRKRDYFSKIKAGDTMHLPEPGPTFGFFLQPIYSWTTGNFEVILSKASQAAGNSGFSGIAALVMRFVSLDEPVMPDGMGFAVIDTSGQVLFHTETGRNLQENFFNECENNPSLQAAVFSGATETLNANYMGRAFRFHTTPLHEGLPWHLVTFQDKLHERSFHLVALSHVALLFLAHAGTMVAFLFLFILFFPRGRYTLRRQWLWPSPQCAPVYAELSLIYAVLLLGEIFNLRSARQDMALGAVFFSGALLVFMTFFKLKMRLTRLTISWSTAINILVYLFLLALLALPLHDSESRILGLPPLLFYPLIIIPLTAFAFPIIPRGFGKAFFRRLYLLAFALFICAAFLFPVVTFWKFAFEFETGLMSRFVQLRFIEDLKQRDRRLADKRVKDLERFVAVTDDRFTTVIEKTISQAKQEVYSYPWQEEDEQSGGELAEAQAQPTEFSPTQNQQETGPLRLVLEAREAFYFPIQFPNFQATSNQVNDYVFRHQFDIYPISPFLGQVNQFGSLSEFPKDSYNPDLSALLSSWIPAFNPVTMGQRYLVKDQEKDRIFSWHQMDHRLFLYHQQRNTRGQHYTISLIPFTFGDAVAAQVPKLRASPLRLLGLILLLAALAFLAFKVLDFVVGKVFLLDLRTIPPVDTRQLTQIINGRHHHSQEKAHYLILGSGLPKAWSTCPGPGESGPNPNWDILDLTEETGIDTRPDWIASVTARFPDGNRPLIINRFDYLHPTKAASREQIEGIKCRLIEHLTKQKSRIIIFSAYDPAIYHQDLPHSNEDQEGKGEPTSPESPQGLDAVDIQNWTNVLAGFHQLSYLGQPNQDPVIGSSPLPDHLPAGAKPNPECLVKAQEETPLQQILLRECRFMPELWALCDFSALEHLQDHEAILAELKDIFKGYYHHLWSKCTRRERWILMDLAQDGFVNPANEPEIRYLFKKRLMVIDGGVRLVNETFRRFILECFASEDVPERTTPERLSWGVLKIPFFMVLLVGSAFFIMTQQEMTKLFVTLSSTILLGAIPVLLKSLGLLKQTSK